MAPEDRGTVMLTLGQLMSERHTIDQQLDRLSEQTIRSHQA
jgi:hypothetical protein